MRWVLATALMFCISVSIGGPVPVAASHGSGELININTASFEILDELEGIGEALANRIIEYRTAHGKFNTIEELIHPNIDKLYQSTFDKIKDHITVVDTTSAITDTTLSTTTATSSEQTTITTVTQYQYKSVTIQPPEDVYIRVPETVTTTAGVFTAFTLESYDATGSVVEDGTVYWAFGDGGEAIGREAGHRFFYEGEYTTSVSLVRGQLHDKKFITVFVVPLSVSVKIGEKGEWVSVHNASTVPLDVSNWRLTTDYQYFNIPEGTVIAGESGVRFPGEVTKLTTLNHMKRVFLRYPTGEIAFDSALQLVTQDEQQEENNVEETVPHEQEVVVNTTSRSSRSIIGSPIRGVNMSEEEIVMPQEEREEIPAVSGSSTQAAATLLGVSKDSGHNDFYWYLGLVAVVLLGVASVLLLKPRKLIVDGFEVIEDKDL